MISLDLREMPECEMWLELHRFLLREGKLTRPRNMLTLEVTDVMLRMNPFNRYSNFVERKLSLRYMCAEFLWYLRGSPIETSIIQYAKFWDQIFDKLNRLEGPWAWSNYGYYIFEGKQLKKCLESLIDDKDSRQASIIIAEARNFLINTTDKICTYSINFSIRDDALHMRVNMRSNDFIKGLQNDFFQFSMLYEIMLAALRRKYELDIGDYIHHVESFHVYERHFDLLTNICDNGIFEKMNPPPRIGSPQEAEDIITHRYNSSSPVVKWMKDFTGYDKVLADLGA